MTSSFTPLNHTMNMRQMVIRSWILTAGVVGILILTVIGLTATRDSYTDCKDTEDSCLMSYIYYDDQVKNTGYAIVFFLGYGTLSLLTYCCHKRYSERRRLETFNRTVDVELTTISQV